MKLTINFRFIFIFLFTFILMYFPNLSYYIKVDGIILFLLFLGMYILKYIISRNHDVLRHFKDKNVILFIILNILFTLYYAIRTSIAGTSLFDFYNLRIVQNLFPILILIAVIIIYYELNCLKYSKFEKFKFIINVATFQGVLCFLMIIIPSFREVAYNIFYQGSSEINIYISASRLYGICDGNYTYSFQILHSFLALFCLNFAYFYKKPKLYINVFLILLVSILNGRTGLLIFAVGFIFLLFYILFKERKLIKFIKYILLIFLFSITVITVANKYLPTTAKLFNHAINDVIGFKNNTIDENNETAHLFSMIRLPNSDLHKIFGAGYRIYGDAGHKFGYFESSDIGFVNDIFMCGVFSILFLYNSYLLFFKYIVRSKKNCNFEKITSLILLISILFSNFKGELFRSQMQISVVLILLYFMYSGVKKDDKIFDNNSSL